MTDNMNTLDFLFDTPDHDYSTSGGQTSLDALGMMSMNPTGNFKTNKTTYHKTSGFSIPFHKYTGTGNDFIMIDNRTGAFDQFLANPKIVQKMCDRHFGIGADGLVEIRKHPRQTYQMRYYNKSGYEGSMCGNGARCSVAFGRHLGILKHNAEATFMTCDGPHYGLYDQINHVVHLRMSDIDAVVQYDVSNYYVDSGSPHHIRYVDDLKNYDVIGEGKRLRYCDSYPMGVNANFVEVGKDGKIQMRTYERGVEDETLSCGTGAVAVGIVECFRNLQGIPLDDIDDMETKHIHTRGGKLTVSFLRENLQKYTGIYLIGPALRVFEGSMIV